ncbi:MULTISPECIES: 4-hydroxy-tetrahydrodipicolinate synthase [unclassified Pseudomonas]|uniref:4-hydroxy-tetrahydrodipicolinate synthase n=1 Tax=unclassified Pseudomonas TaxID=196821 RepID=UPI000C86AF3F|nr:MULTISPECIES: 4-hydroxy-tetrahydrodipicolinate synthase [unclassified Pseudomonas]PMV17774.1 4-hydroxy-tetrahydrodipicolinate synthase [Pseudomonas sp. FW305-3-2-15-C-TSA2]PMV19160.1 4-hydroxy-tetrahydrodipicolinate synthase [Pseudomonas sp. DP16D-L5]PMV37880.1 4-hydroxy-tetrahydrodipicolinate synthase [Pseudomonas sp. FW305-3-2-15-A-LB2]PMV42888.1 4-hydroxy-tetrahydrodipicolinate synthase [Pseudomonas sp. FW305-3-2-15-C-LB1]PMV44283.1 4-hydroxy-tetrahydrodipicolinate synthase [Pseudomonas 
MSSFQGIWVPVVTPFHDGAIDFIGLHRLVNHLLEKHVAGIMVCTTTGEAASLSRQEQLAVLDAVLQWVPAHRVVMGLAGYNQIELLHFQREILQRPVAGLLVPAPSYIRPSQAGLEAFFRTVADASSVPIILYDIPYRTGATFEQATLLNIVAHERIVAIKDCGGNLDNTLALLASGEVDVLCGEDLQIFNALCLGATGAIAASAHVNTEQFVALCQQVRDNQLADARATFMQLVPLINTLFMEPNPAPVKAAMALQGLIGSELRAPMQAASVAVVARLQQVQNLLG